MGEFKKDQVFSVVLWLGVKARSCINVFFSSCEALLTGWSNLASRLWRSSAGEGWSVVVVLGRVEVCVGICLGRKHVDLAGVEATGREDNPDIEG